MLLFVAGRVDKEWKRKTERLRREQTVEYLREENMTIMILPHLIWSLNDKSEYIYKVWF